jgi:signal recognition particle subunit SEC65
MIITVRCIIGERLPHRPRGNPARRWYPVANFIHDKGFVKTVCFICLIAILGIDPLFAASDKSLRGIPTNFEIIERISAETVQEIISGLGTIRQEDVVLLNKTKTAGNVDFVLENAFVREMRNAGIRLAIEAPKKDEAVVASGNFRLSYQIVRLSLSYPRISRKWRLGSKVVARAAQADVFVQFIDLATGDIAWVKEIHKEYNDTIDYSKLKLVEEAQYDFTRPSRSEFKMTKLLEPLVVGGIVVGLVYLFFSNQSSK